MWKFRRRRRRYSFQYQEKKRKQMLARGRQILSWSVLIFAAALCAFVMVMLFGRQTMVMEDSMKSTLSRGQSVYVNRLIYKFASPKIGDIIVFYPNGNQKLHGYVKRVVAVGGDTVQIKDGILYVNGKPQDTGSAIYDKMKDAGIAESRIRLGSGEYFVLGDNRNESEDSRSANIGMVTRDMILGKVWHVGALERELG